MMKSTSATAAHMEVRIFLELNIRFSRFSSLLYSKKHFIRDKRPSEDNSHVQSREASSPDASQTGHVVTAHKI